MLDKETLKEQIVGLMQELSFPKEAIESLKNDFERLVLCDGAYTEFCEIKASYDATVDIDYSGALEVMKRLSTITGVHEYALNMLHFLSLCPKLRERYKERGLSDKLFIDTMRDLTFKVDECHLVYGVWGTFVPTWYARFFCGFDRFFFVRLQLEPVELKYDCTVNGKEYKAGAKALSVHIPRTCTPLKHEEVVASYHAAAEFFKDYFGADPVLMICNSWLLNPQHDEMLKPGSNMLLFAHDFTLANVGVYNDNAGLWRTFDCQFTGDIDALPTDTTLRRAYVDLLKRGEKLKYAYGVIDYADFAKKYPKI